MKPKEWKKQRRFRQRFARLLQKILNKQIVQPPYNGPLNSIVILAQEKYGDAILLTPLLQQLKQQFPDTAVHVVTFSKATHDFFRYDRNIDSLYLAKGNAAIYYRQILTHRFDMLFNTKDHPSTSFLIQSLIIRARWKVGIDCTYHRGIYDYLIDLDYHPQIALKNCGLLDILGKTVKPETCRPYIPQMPVSPQVKEFIRNLPEGALLGINISAGKSNRYWIEDKWKELVEAFPDERFLVLSAPEDHARKAKLEQQCPNIVPSPSTINLYETSLIIEKTRMLVTPDTALVHVASCSGTPVLGLYGMAPQDQSRFRPFMIKHSMAISPTTHIQDISAKLVIESLNTLLRP